MLLSVLMLWFASAGQAFAVEGTLTLEGCRSDGTPYPPDGPFVCDSGDYTTGNLGKNWDELDNVPFRLTIKSGNSAIADAVAVVVDREDATRPGFDRISNLTLVGGTPGCASTIAVNTVPASPGVGGIDVSIFRTIDYSQPANLTCVYDFYARLAFGSHLFPGASLHANLAELSFDQNNQPVLSTNGVGARDVSIPVNELTPPEVDASITAVGDSDTTWTLSKTADESELDFGDVCAAPEVGDLQAQVKFNVAWTQSVVAGGQVNLNVKVTATSFASRNLEVQAKGTIVANATGGTLNVEGDKVELAADANQQVILDKDYLGSAIPGGAGGVGDSVTFDDVTVSFFDPDDSGVLLGTTDPISATALIVQGSTSNSTATVSDTETISALPALLKFSSAQFPSIGDYQNGYVEGSLTKGPVGWNSDTQSGDGTVQFTSNVALGERRIISGAQLDNAASLLASDGFAPAPVSVSVALTSSASVKLAIRKRVTVTPADFLQPGQSIKVKFDVAGALGYGSSQELVFDAVDFDAAGVATKSLPAITGLVPDTYTVTETGSFLVADGSGTPISLNDVNGQQRVVNLQPQNGGLMTGRCAGKAYFVNAFTPKLPRAEVMKVTVPTSPEGGTASPWSFTLKGPGLPLDGVTVGDNANDGAGTDFGVDLVKAGTYEVTETLQTGWDLTSVEPSLPASPARCTFTVSFPADTGATKSCTFTNTKRGKVKLVKTVNDAPLTNTAYAFTFQVREGASTRSDGTVLSSGIANSANGGTVNFTRGGTYFFLIPGQTYQLCEVNLPGGWQTTLGVGGFVPNSLGEEFDNSTVCKDFTALAGLTVTFNVDNDPPPEGDARTIGYWKNHASCSNSKGKQDPVTDKTLQAAGNPGIFIGRVNLTDTNPDPKVASSCAATVRLLDKRDNKRVKRARSPLFNLASQLTAAKLNIVANAGSCQLANDAIADGSALLQSVGFNGTLTPASGYPALTAAQAKIANATAGLLDDYNNNELCP